ncbi:MAPEG family protein [Ferrimonas marina]|uniref:Uncharacterized conserved protein, MAPEG superfamily n=1 Tax=Ferrimonas marina TaxID=299255 RepID=A0A1M5RAY4_9GAMM|nr:MAPEG family protein [Ferrimonas marina]SHH22973.1 Uncharacterized conserved protein, MAPEG superfamily [Ferrimonas marina]
MAYLVLIALALIPYLLAGLGGWYKLRHLGNIDTRHPRQQDAQLSGTAHRITSAQRNAWEALGFFSAGLLASQLRGAPLEALALPSLLFLLTRLAHPLFYIGDRPTLRSATVVFGLFVGLYLALLAG